MHCLGSKLQLKVSHGTGKRRGYRVQSQMPTPSFQQLPVLAFASNKMQNTFDIFQKQGMAANSVKDEIVTVQESKIDIVCRCDPKGSAYAFERPMLTSIPG